MFLIGCSIVTLSSWCQPCKQYENCLQMNSSSSVSGKSSAPSKMSKMLRPRRAPEKARLNASDVAPDGRHMRTGRPRGLLGRRAEVLRGTREKGRKKGGGAFSVVFGSP